MSENKTWSKDDLQRTLHEELQGIIDMLNDYSTYPEMLKSGELQIILGINGSRIDRSLRYHMYTI